MRVYASAYSPKKIGNLLYSSFSGNKEEVMIIGELLAGRLSHAKLIRELMEKLNASDRQATDQLFAKVNKIRTRFISYARSEPATSTHYTRMFQLLRLLSKLVDVFRKKVIETLRVSLEEINSGRKVNEHEDLITSADVQEIQGVFADYLQELDKYCNEFKQLLDAESTSGTGIKIKTILEQSLSDLMEEISMNIYQHETTEALLNNWRLRLEFVEMEECYN